MNRTNIKARLKRAVRGENGEVRGLILGEHWISTGHWVIERGELIAQGLPLGDAKDDAATLRGMGFDISGTTLTDLSVCRVIPDVSESSGVSYVATAWINTLEGPGPCRLLREEDGPRWCLVQVRYLELIGDGMLYRAEPASTDEFETPLVLPKRRFGVMPAKRGSAGEALEGLKLAGLGLEGLDLVP